MDRRHRYLAALGVELWRRRTDRVQLLSTTPAEPNALADEAMAATAASRPDPPPVASGDHRGERIAAMDWDELAEAVAGCAACPLHQSRTQGVFGVGHRRADWMIIGEAPGADEDRIGEPFVGRAGKLLDLMLRAIGLDRDRVYIANILKSRPPSNRDPKPEEIAACWPYLARQIALVQPKLFLVVGRIAAQSLLETQTPVGKLRGRVHRFQDRPLVVTYHPAYLLRSPSQKAKSWADLQLARRALDEAAA